MYAEFTDDLITGNEMIDSQHRELISRINDLLVSCENRSNQSGAARLLNYLADYQRGRSIPEGNRISGPEGAP